MAKRWVTHLPHFLDKTGNIPRDISPSARRIAKALCTFVAYATHFDDEEEERPQCFILIKKKRCRGKVDSLLSLEDDNIIWQCDLCKNWGTISGWQGTVWDLTHH